ncbi:MAG: thymidine phosphorylase family protein [Chrysiogenetes bacterium]|nr:thymidine phosphorylase family protein [Chrysiogenetes bacterium]
MSTFTQNGDGNLRLKRLGIDTYQEHILYLREDAPVVRSEGFASQARVEVRLGENSLIATLDIVKSEILEPGQASLSEGAWCELQAQEGDHVHLSHAAPVESLGYVRAKLYGHRIGHEAMNGIIEDIVQGRYSDVHLAAFIAACSGENLDRTEIVSLTQAMIDVGDHIDWGSDLVMDKHCVGGLPGNRTTPIVVAIIAAFGLMMPKTSSRAITSPAGTADTMEVLTNVDLSIEEMRRVVEQENGCIAWGGAVSLSPADDILIGVERVLDVDSQGQLVASVISKKAAAGSTHVLLDLPVGPTAKVRSLEAARSLRMHLVEVARAVGLEAKVLFTDGNQPVGRGIGPALEARDVLAVLQGNPDAPRDLRDRSLALAAGLLEMSGRVPQEQGDDVALAILDEGRAWKKFQAICEAQGALRMPPTAPQRHEVLALHAGRVSAIDNRMLARVAKLAGAPKAASAGLVLHVKIGDLVEPHQPLFTLHAETPGELAYSLEYVNGRVHEIITLEHQR